jgi:hypothetical protein
MNPTYACKNHKLLVHLGFSTFLLSQAELRDNFSITLNVVFAHVLKQRRPGSDHFQQAPPGCVVFTMNLQMLGEVINPFGQ